MTLQYTPNYRLAYLDASTPLVQLADASQQVAQSLDAAMGRAGYTPPDATTFAAEVTARQNADTALSGRVSSLEAVRVAPAALSFYSGFATFDAANFESVQCWREGRTAYLIGLVRVSTSITADTTKPVVGLPPALRPAKTCIRITAANAATNIRFDIQPGGDVVVFTPPGQALAANTFVSLASHWLTAS